MTNEQTIGIIISVLIGATFLFGLLAIHYAKHKSTPVEKKETNSDYRKLVIRISEVLHNKYWELDENGIPPFDISQVEPELINQAQAMIEEMYQCFSEGWMTGLEDFDVVQQTPDMIISAKKRGLLPVSELYK